MPTILDYVSYIMTKGWSKEQSIGILANGIAESNLDPANTSGDGGLAHGAFQWHPDRRANFLQVIGKPVHEATLYQQLDFVDWELRNTHKVTGAKLAGANNINDATRIFMIGFEAPKDQSAEAIMKRQKIAAGILDRPDGVVGAALGNVIGGPGLASLMGYDTSSITGGSQIFDWIKTNALNIMLGAIGVSIILFGAYNLIVSNMESLPIGKNK